MRKIKAAIVSTIAIIMMLFMQIPVNAAGTGVLECVTGERSIFLYIRDGQIDATATSLVGTSENSLIKAEKIVDMQVPMQTLIMVDNSLSIKDADRVKTAELIQNLIADRLNGEQISIATFDEDITYLCDFTDDYGTLKETADSIEYRDLETYLSDVLYKVISEDFNDGENVYRRIIIISDGVDNKSLGITKDELYNLLKTKSYPIYTMGCANRNKTNNDELENMFALSRMSGASEFLLDNIDNTLDITSALNSDREITRYEIMPEPGLLDGSTKTVKLYVNGECYETDAKMPQVAMVIETPSEAPSQSPASSVTHETVEVEAADEEEETAIPWLLIAIIAAAVLIVTAVIVVIIIVATRKNKDKDKFEAVDNKTLDDIINHGRPDTERTEYVMGNFGALDDESTIGLWNNSVSHQVVLTDLTTPGRTFQVPLSGSISVGRKVGNSIVLDYEKSISGKHCEISTRNGHFYIKDLQSSNGTFVNGSRVLSEVELFSGNVLKLGRLEIRFEVR